MIQIKIVEIIVKLTQVSFIEWITESSFCFIDKVCLVFQIKIILLLNG